MEDKLNNTRILKEQIFFRFLPSLISDTLLEDIDFKSEYSFEADAVLTFNNSDTFKRNELYNAVRNYMNGIKVKSVPDINGADWNILNTNKDGEIPTLVLSNGRKKLALHNLVWLSKDKCLRLRFLEESASDVNLPDDILKKWRNILSERALNNEEVDVLLNEMKDTPIHQSRLIRNEFLKDRGLISNLISSSPSYYERLAGKYDGSSSLSQYVANNIRGFFEQLSSWKRYDGFLLSLLLSSHSLITDEIIVEQISKEDLLKAFQFIQTDGDRVSQLGVIEVGLRVFSELPEIEQVLIQIIEQIRDDDTNGQNSHFSLFSALFMLAYAEISRIKLFLNEPPFYKRLVALSHAALIQRQIHNSKIVISDFFELIMSNYGLQYTLQSLIDMRIETSCFPALALASEIKENFIARIIIAANKNKQSIHNTKLFDLILGDNGLKTLIKNPCAFNTGLLDTKDIRIEVPPQMDDAIKSQLNQEDISPSSFIALINSSFLYGLEKDNADLAANVLKSCNYRLKNIGSKEQLLTVINGLANVAAVTRSCSLANELRIVVRRYMREKQYDFPINEVVQICLLASASYIDLYEWRDFIGDWFTEFAFGKLEDNDGEVFHSNLQYLCHLVPELWVSCGKAEAALIAYINR